MRTLLHLLSFLSQEFKFIKVLVKKKKRIQEGSVAVCGKHSPHEPPALYWVDCGLHCIIWHWELWHVPPLPWLL